MEDVTMNFSPLSLNKTNDSSMLLAIPFCRKDLEPVMWASYCGAAVNFIGMTINIIHIFILSKLGSLKGSPYLWILVHISFADAYQGFITALRLILSNPLNYLSFNLPGFVAYSTIAELAIIGRNYLLAIASFERYFTLCRPMEYGEIKFINNINLCLCLVWVYQFIFNLTRDVVFRTSICFQFAVGPTGGYGPGPGLLNILNCFIPATVTAVTLSRVSVELFRMRKRANSHGEEQVKAASQYLFIIVTIYYLCFFIPIIEYALQISGGFVMARYYVNMVFILASYGILNTVIYGWRTPAYRRRLVNMLPCIRAKAKIAPATITTQA